jgi:hypothetical protein
MAEFVKEEYKGENKVADPNKMVGDLISRAAAINAICEDGTQLERQGQYTMTMAERKQRDADILDALPSAKPVAKDTNVPAKDCISRQAAIDALADYIHNVDRVYSTGKLTHEDCMDAAHSVLDELPSAQQWIPCSERLPEKDGEYLVTMLYFGEKTVALDWFSHYETDDEDNGKPLWVYGYDNVIAWMPLPEPWKGEQDEERKDGDGNES